MSESEKTFVGFSASSSWDSDSSSSYSRPVVTPIIDVKIGEVRSVKGRGVLRTKAIGSCIALAVCDSLAKTAALAHIMLPGKAPSGKRGIEKTKYAFDAVGAICTDLAELGSGIDSAFVFLVGGGNVLNRKGDTICVENINSVLGILVNQGLKVKGTVLGGMCRRSLSVDVGIGEVAYTEDNSTRKLFV